MVSWGWIPISLIVGAVIGVFWIGMVDIAREDKAKKKEWNKDD